MESTNWTIVRPYITYNNYRLQLGVFEKELWISQVLHGKTLVLPKDIAEHTTTLTWGEDVAKGIASLVGNQKACGQAVHIATDESLHWQEVLEIYRRVFREVKGKPIKVKWIESSERLINEGIANLYQVRYDRLFDRRFNNEKIIRLSGGINFVSPKDGLEKCLKTFLAAPKFVEVTTKGQAWMDKEAKEFTSLSEFAGCKKKLEYIVGRYTPYFKIQAKKK